VLVLFSSFSSRSKRLALFNLTCSQGDLSNDLLITED
jgi:hypothetical protein